MSGSSTSKFIYKTEFLSLKKFQESLQKSVKIQTLLQHQQACMINPAFQISTNHVLLAGKSRERKAHPESVKQWQ